MKFVFAASPLPMYIVREITEILWKVSLNTIPSPSPTPTAYNISVDFPHILLTMHMHKVCAYAWTAKYVDSQQHTVPIIRHY